MRPTISGNGFASPRGDYLGLDHAHPRDVLVWAVAAVERLAIATSFQSAGLVALHLLQDIKPDIPVLFLDTGFHFPETLAFRGEVARRWQLNVVDLHGEYGSAEAQAAALGPELYARDPDKCCFINKVEPLQRALEDYDGWISGIRRDQSPLRAETPTIEAQLLRSGREVLKIHPLASWSKADVAAYVEEHDIPTHPLLERGFASIGCWPCTRSVTTAEHERAGRWDGFHKTECGIHSFGRAGANEAEQ